MESEQFEQQYQIHYRQYSVATDEDSKNIKNGRCPNYALTWQTNFNEKHWPIGHDYFMGNGENLDDNDKEIRQILSEKLARGTLPNKLVFCDLDGVLADFEQGVKNRFKKLPDELNASLMWGVINKSTTFFETLPWMPKGKQLWESIKKYDPIILTGVPPNSKTAAEQKRRWCAKELGPDIHVITCLTKDKSKYCKPDSVLIDDRTDNLNNWNYAGGKFFLYDEDFIDSIVRRLDKHLGDGISSP